MIKGQNIPQSSKPDAQLLDAKAYQTDLVNHETTYNHSDIHPKFSDAETPASMGALILSANEKTTPVDADMVSIMDTADSNKLKKLSWANVKVVLKVYFDTLYAAASTISFPGFGTSGSSACVGNDARLSDSRTPVAHSHATSDVTGFATAALAAAPAETATTIGALINAATAITAPDDTDVIAMRNHTGGLLHKMTWAYVKSVLKTYFDGIYQSTGSYLTSGGSLGTPSGGDLANCTFPVLNQNTSGTAANLSGGPAITVTSVSIGSINRMKQQVSGTIADNGQYEISNLQSSRGSILFTDTTSTSYVPFYFNGLSGGTRKWSFMTSAGWQYSTNGNFTHTLNGGNAYNLLFESSTGILYVNRISGSGNYTVTILFD